MTSRETGSPQAAAARVAAASDTESNFQRKSAHPSSEAARLAAELEEACTTAQRLRKEIEDTRTERWRAEIKQQGRIRELERLNREQARTLKELRASTSWRITEPLRQSSAWLSRQRARSGQLLQALKSSRADASGTSNNGAPGRSLPMGTDYAEWIRRFDVLGEEDVRLIKAHIAGTSLPAIRVMWSLGDCSAADLERAVNSLCSQFHGGWTARLLVADGALADQAAASLKAAGEPRIEVMASDWTSCKAGSESCVLFVERPGQLAPHALYLMAEAARRQPDAVVLSDDDTLAPDGARSAPRFLPRYSAELPSVGSLALIPSIQLPAALRGSKGLRSMVMRAVESSHLQPAHVPFVTFHASTLPEPLTTTSSDAILQGNAATPLPFITVVIPTRDRFDLMRPCLSSILERTDYPANRFEIIVIDNGSVETELLAYLEVLARNEKIRVIRDPRRFNYARLNNLAVAQSQGDLLAFVNNDIEVHDPQWLRRLASMHTGPKWVQ